MGFCPVSHSLSSGEQRYEIEFLTTFIRLHNKALVRGPL